MKQHRDRYENQDDAALVACVLAGEREAFDILLLRYSSSVLRLRCRAARRHLRGKTCTRLEGRNAPAHPKGQAGTVGYPRAMTIELRELADMVFYVVAASWLSTLVGDRLEVVAAD